MEQYLSTWERLMGDKARNNKLLELTKAPEKFRGAIIEFKNNYEEFVKKSPQCNRDMMEMMKKYLGKENDLNAMHELEQILVNIINDYEISINVDIMKRYNIYLILKIGIW